MNEKNLRIISLRRINIYTLPKNWTQHEELAIIRYVVFSKKIQNKDLLCNKISADLKDLLCNSIMIYNNNNWNIYPSLMFNVFPKVEVPVLFLLQPVIYLFLHFVLLIVFRWNIILDFDCLYKIRLILCHKLRVLVRVFCKI